LCDKLVTCDLATITGVVQYPGTITVFGIVTMFVDGKGET